MFTANFIRERKIFIRERKIFFRDICTIAQANSPIENSQIRGIGQTSVESATKSGSTNELQFRCDRDVLEIFDYAKGKKCLDSPSACP
jgi:hypothetical protein